MSGERKSYEAGKEHEGQRLDVFLSEQAGLSRSIIKKLQDSVTLNGNGAKLSAKVCEGDIAELSMLPAEPGEIKAENIPIDIIYEDEYIAVINKQAGMVVHPSSGEYSGTLVNALLYHLKGMNFYGEKERAGIVHRLDKDTSGLLVTAKSADIVERLQAQFKERSVEKVYRAIVRGIPKTASGMIDSPIGRHPVYRKKCCVREDGRDALSYYSVEEEGAEHSLLKVRIKTGRTHQIRVHLSSIGHPVCGDELYSKSYNKYECLMLASTMLSFNHPHSAQRMDFTVELPGHMKKLLNSSNF